MDATSWIQFPQEIVGEKSKHSCSLDASVRVTFQVPEPTFRGTTAAAVGRSRHRWQIDPQQKKRASVHNAVTRL